MDRLPIDLIPNTNPPRFKWAQVVNVPFEAGRKVVDTEGPLPPNVEESVAALIRLHKEALRENAMLRGQVEAQERRLAEAEKQHGKKKG